MKDILERNREPNLNLNLKDYLQSSYVHPVFKGGDNSGSDGAGVESDQEPELVPTKRHSQMNTPLPSKQRGSSRPSLSEVHINS